MKTSLFILSLVFVSSAFSSEIMVERMQSVVDEVSELRLRYESSAREKRECLAQVQEQEKVMKKISMGEGIDYKVFEENRKKLQILEDENLRLKKNAKKVQDAASLQTKIYSLEKELIKRDKQNIELKKKNDDLQTEAKTHNVSAKPSSLCILLEDEKKDLKKKLITSKSKECKLKTREVKTLYVDDNPFPKLMMKDENEIHTTVKKEKIVLPHTVGDKPVIDKSPTFVIADNVCADLIIEGQSIKSLEIISSEASAYRVKKESSVYDAPQGQIIDVWEENTSFTSNVSTDDWIKITGYFVDKKWRKARKEMWVKKEETLKR